MAMRHGEDCSIEVLNGHRRASLARRLMIAAAAALVASLWVLWRYWGAPLGSPQYIPSDFDQLWFGARELLSGRNPYLAIGPGRSFDYEWPLLYPVPALLVASPFALLPLEYARAAFAGASTAILTWALLADGTPFRLPVLLSVPFAFAILRGQWSPWLLAGFWWAPGSFSYVAKPSLGAAVFAARPRWVAVFGGCALILLGLAVQPDWPRAWLNALRGATTLVPITQIAAGWIPLLALARWRLPEARLVALTACVPQTFVHYEAIYAFAVVRTRTECLSLAVLSAIGYGIGALRPYPPVLADAMRQHGPWMFLLLYAPAVFLLWSRPHVGRVPQWLETLALWLPAFARGRAESRAERQPSA